VRSRLTLAVAVALCAASVLAPVSAQATLVFTRGPLNPIIWAANDDGSSKKPIVSGAHPRISPDGTTIAYYRQQKAHGYRPELMVAAADGSGSPQRLLPGWRESFLFDWAPDSSSVAVLGGPETGSKRLLVIDVASGAQRTVARGYFSGFSFAPEGGRLVYAKAGSETYPSRSDLYSVELSSGKATRLTKDHRSQYPLWGPNGQIVFVKLLDEKKRRFGPKNELYLMNADGGQVRRLTHTKVDPLLQGLFPTQWSADGTRLLAEFEGQDTSYAVRVDTRGGAQHPVGKAGEQGLVGAALSADGSMVLGATGGFEPGPGHNVVSVPYGGGKAKVLVPNAFEPDWNH
jgi:Tol biopolymer transport system component